MEVTREQVNQAVNKLWKLHDKALEQGNESEADQYKQKAFELLELLPENRIYVTVRQ